MSHQIQTKRFIVNISTALALQKHRALSCPRRSYTNNKLRAKALLVRAGREKTAKSSLMKFSHKYHRAAKRQTLPGSKTQSDPWTCTTAHLPRERWRPTERKAP